MHWSRLSPYHFVAWCVGSKDTYHNHKPRTVWSPGALIDCIVHVRSEVKSVWRRRNEAGFLYHLHLGFGMQKSILTTLFSVQKSGKIPCPRHGFVEILVDMLQARMMRWLVIDSGIKLCISLIVDITECCMMVLYSWWCNGMLCAEYAMPIKNNACMPNAKKENPKRQYRPW